MKKASLDELVKQLEPHLLSQGSVNGHSLCVLERVMIFLHWASVGASMSSLAMTFNCSYGVIDESIAKVITALNASDDATGPSFVSKYMTCPEGEDALNSAEWFHFISGFPKLVWGAIGKINLRYFLFHDLDNAREGRS